MTVILLILGALAWTVACIGAGVQIGLHARLRPTRTPKPTPRAARHNPTLTDRAIRHEPEPAIRLPVVYQYGATSLPAHDSDETYELLPTRVDLLSEHTDRARRWRP